MRSPFGSGPETRPPRGALAVVAVGLIATVAAALLSTTKIIGVVALEWEKTVPIPTSRDVEIPGGGAMRIGHSQLSVTEANVSGYKIFRVSAVLSIDAGSAVGQARVNCAPSPAADDPRQDTRAAAPPTPARAAGRTSSNRTSRTKSSSSSTPMGPIPSRSN